MMNTTISLSEPTPSSPVNVTTAFITVPGNDSRDYVDYYNTAAEDLDNSGPCEYEEHGSRFLPVLYSLFFVLGLLGNLLVLWVILKGMRLRSMTDVCLLNLALADLLLVCTLPFLAHHARDQWVFGDAMCKLVLSVYLIGFYSGIFFITLMGIDRYLAIVHAVYAMRVRTPTYGALASIVVWIVAILASFPEILFLKIHKQNNGNEYCMHDYDENKHLGAFGIFKMNTLGFLVPLSIMGFCYSMILRRLFNIRSSKRKAVRLVVLVMVVFFCCWTPYNIASFLRGIELMEIHIHVATECDSSKAIRLSLQITEVVAYFHSCLNPILYVFVGQKFRRHLARLLQKTPCMRCWFMKDCLAPVGGSVYSVSSNVDERSTVV